MINIQSTLRNAPDLCKNVSLAVLFCINGNSHAISTQTCVYIHMSFTIHRRWSGKRNKKKIGTAAECRVPRKSSRRGFANLDDVNSFLTSTLRGGLQPGLRPAIPTQKGTGWATEPVCTQWTGGGRNLFPPPQIVPEFPVAKWVYRCYTITIAGAILEVIRALLMEIRESLEMSLCVARQTAGVPKNRSVFI
jgi:hypothetical protein